MAKANIMIVEDDAVTAMDIENQLKNLGYSVTAIASYGKDAIQKVKENTPDLVLMDIVLKGKIDGIEASEEIRNLFDVPVIFLTAFADKKRLKRAKLTNPFGYILKPFQDKDLEVTIEMALYVARVDSKRKQAEVVLRKTHEQLEATLNALPDLLFEVDQHGHIYDFRAPDPNLLYIPPSDFLNHTIREVLPKKVAQIIMDAINEAVKKGWHKGNTYSLEISGKVHWFELSIAVKGDPKTQDGHLIVMARDITKRKQTEEALRESEKRYRIVLETAADPLIVYDNTGKLLYLNPAFTSTFGWTFEELFDKKIPFVPDEYLDEARSAITKCYSDGYYRFETRRYDKKGNILDVSLSGAIWRDPQGEPQGMVVNLKDITERKRGEEERKMLYDELKSLNLELEEKVKNRTMAFELAAQKANAANRAKSEFLASMSHELRTPLNAIIGFSEVLRDKYFGELNKKQADYVKDILESGKHLLSLISDILDLSKVEAGKMELELSPVNIKALLEDSLGMIKEKAHEHGIGLDLKIPEEMSEFEIQADERKLKQIIFNLLSNAKKFTPDGGTITLQADQKDEELIVSVEDSGIGIAPEDKEKIFDDFYQVKGGYTGKTPGTGLGLPLIKSLVEMHGGRIWVESEGEGKGSTFTFVIPFT